MLLVSWIINNKIKTFRWMRWLVRYRITILFKLFQMHVMILQIHIFTLTICVMTIYMINRWFHIHIPGWSSTPLIFYDKTKQSSKRIAIYVMWRKDWQYNKNAQKNILLLRNMLWLKCWDWKWMRLIKLLIIFNNKFSKLNHSNTSNN